MHADMISAGRILWEAGHLHYTSGNLSVRTGSHLWITRSGAPLGYLTRRHMMRVALTSSRFDRGASSEAPVHRAIYRANPQVRAIAHSHAPYATVQASHSRIIRPRDSDRLFIPRIPVMVSREGREGSRDVAKRLSALLRHDKVAAIRGHGLFAVGADILECVTWLTMAEHQCRFLYLSDR